MARLEVPTAARSALALLLMGLTISGFTDVFLFFGFLLLLGALAVAWLGEETRGRTLKEISR